MIPLPAQAQQEAVVASTTWTAALARAAGADAGHIRVIAPPDMQQPFDYIIQDSDLAGLEGASLLVYTGEEPFAEALLAAAEAQGVTALQVAADTDPESVRVSARQIAEALGTTAAYESWLAEFEPFATELADEVTRAFLRKEAVVHVHHSPLASWFQFVILDRFGPEQLGSSETMGLAGMSPVIVIDDAHSPVGETISNNAQRVVYVRYIRFPGAGGTVEDVYRTNADVTITTAKEAGQLPESRANVPLMVGLLVGCLAVVIFFWWRQEGRYRWGNKQKAE